MSSRLRNTKLHSKEGVEKASHWQSMEKPTCKDRQQQVAGGGKWLKQWLQVFTGSYNYPTGCALQSAQVRLVTTLVGGLSVSGFRFYIAVRFLPVKNSWLAPITRWWRVLDQFISFSKCCRRPDRCIERLQELCISVTAYNWGFPAGCVARPKSKCH